MGFHIVARDTATASTASEFDEQNEAQTGFGGGVGAFFGGPSASITNTVTYVSSTKKDSSDSLDINADLTGEVDLKFKSDYLPLERFAQPNLIALIQGNTPNPPANAPVKGGGMDTRDAKSNTPAPATAPAGAPAGA
jgi:hypothetical protein